MPLARAANIGEGGAVQMLLSYGVPVDAAGLVLLRRVLDVQRQRSSSSSMTRTWLGMTQWQIQRLLRPAGTLSLDVLQMLTEAGLLVDTRDPDYDDTTFLWLITGTNSQPVESFREAALVRREVVVRMLIDAGADVNVMCYKVGFWPREDTRYKTPLYRAVEGGFTDVAAPLLARGADITLRDTTATSMTASEYDRGSYGSGGTLLTRAAGHPHVLKLLLDYYRQPDKSLSPLIKEQMEQRDDYDRTVLLYATQGGMVYAPIWANKAKLTTE